MKIEDTNGILTEVLEENRLLKERLKETHEDIEVESLSALSIERVDNKMRITGILLAEGTHNGIHYSGDEIKAMVDNYKNEILGMNMTVEHEKMSEYGNRVVGIHTHVEFNPVLNAALYTADISDEDAINDIESGKFQATSMRIKERKITVGDYTKATNIIPINNTLTQFPACSNCNVFHTESLSLKYYGIRSKPESDDESVEDIAATEAQIKAMKTRCAKYPISPKIEHGGHVTKPKQYADVPEGSFADPCNFKYPMTPQYVRAAWSYSGKPENKTKGGYSDAEWGWMRNRIKNRMKVAGHKVEDKSEGDEEIMEDLKKDSHGCIIGQEKWCPDGQKCVALTAEELEAYKEMTDKNNEGEEELKRKRCPYCSDLFESLPKHFPRCNDRNNALTKKYMCNHCENNFNTEKLFITHLDSCQEYKLAQEDLSEPEPEPKPKPTTQPPQEPTPEPTPEPVTVPTPVPEQVTQTPEPSTQTPTQAPESTQTPTKPVQVTTPAPEPKPSTPETTTTIVEKEPPKPKMTRQEIVDYIMGLEGDAKEKAAKLLLEAEKDRW